jgi:hypothetical protein
MLSEEWLSSRQSKSILRERHELKSKLDYDVAYFQKTGVKIPPPEKRLCRKHGRPITPSHWIRGHKTSDCAKCTNTRIRSSETKLRRTRRWEKDFISCVLHLERRCNKSAYVGWGRRRCGSCDGRSFFGRKKPSKIRWLNRAGYAKAMQRRSRLYGRLRGIALFERSTGLKLTFPNMRITG